MGFNSGFKGLIWYFRANIREQDMFLCNKPKCPRPAAQLRRQNNCRLRGQRCEHKKYLQKQGRLPCVRAVCNTFCFITVLRNVCSVFK